MPATLLESPRERHIPNRKDQPQGVWKTTGQGSKKCRMHSTDPELTVHISINLETS